ncbi:hypothetical protein [Enhygromyxa salina]|uniref:hypothetical protein n=1 Tax=Enhygromyxa salina TaxID=215803 RepID=UPI000697B386|nr:hypothetical protein [Enhygromyxa salina]
MRNLLPFTQISAYFAFAAILGGCLDADESLDDATRSAASPVVVLDDFDEPFQEELERRLGVTNAEVQDATDEARVQWVLGCVESRGQAAWIEQVRAIVATSPEEATTLLDLAASQLESANERAGKDVANERLWRCVEGAEGEINPRWELALLLEDATLAISDRLEVDPEMIAAIEEERRCVRASTLGNYGVALLHREDLLVSEIMKRVSSGDMTRVDGLEELRDLAVLRAEREPLMAEVQDCTNRRIRIEQILVVEQQRAYLAANPGWIDGIAERYRAIIAPLQDYLED